ncbi:hypothetical protein RM530_11620 [Algiphilus sp. W345]|uniref:Uncharacterized protein n=1 Tax=Banduia mediterranea TaxID=3075609 RepID=A0ABU2WJF4_9GAMM|nr:hypothetical protein [Algiphilus sp. W345]MDT0498006.1 hypothetical protein [Algiphilus sp. W345]
MSLAAEHSCDLHWDGALGLWVVQAISYDADACSLSAETLLRIDAQEFLAQFIPDRP